MAERHVSLISLPDFGVPELKYQEQSYYDSFYSKEKEDDRLISSQASIGNFTSKFAASSKVDLAAAFRRQLSRASGSQVHQKAESVYSATSELHYEPRCSRTSTSRQNGLKKSSETMTFGLDTNRSDVQSDRSIVERRRPPVSRRKKQSSTALRNIRESSGFSETDSEHPRGRSLSIQPKKRLPRRRADQSVRPYNKREGPLMQAMSQQIARMDPRFMPPLYHDFRYPYQIAPPLQQPGGANQHIALSATASRSLLTCSKDFQSQFPNVYSGLCKGLIDVSRLIQHEVVIPIKEEIALHKNAIRSRRTVIAAISEQLWKPLHGKFPDPAIAPKLVKKVSEYFFDKIEAGIQQAEGERSLLQWAFRFDVENATEIRVTTSLGVGYNSAIANIEGAAHVRRRKGDLLSLLNPDTVTIDMDIVVKALFLNGGQLTEINNDPMFIDRVQSGENRFAASFINMY